MWADESLGGSTIKVTSNLDWNYLKHLIMIIIAVGFIFKQIQLVPKNNNSASFYP